MKVRGYCQLVFVILFLAVILYSPDTSAGECDSCSACTNESSIDNNLTILNTNLALPDDGSDNGPMCINVTARHVIIRCNGYEIIGEPGIGTLVNASNAHNVTVENCKFSGGLIGVEFGPMNSNHSNITNSIFHNITNAVLVGSFNGTYFNNTFNDTGTVGNAFLNFSHATGVNKYCEGNNFVNNTFYDASDPEGGNETLIVFNSILGCSNNNFTGNTFSLNTPGSLIANVFGSAVAGSVGTLFFKNNFLNGTLNFSNSTAELGPHFLFNTTEPNGYGFGNHYHFYNDSGAEGCDKSQTVSDGENYSVCVLPSNLSNSENNLSWNDFSNDSFPRIAMHYYTDRRVPYIANIVAPANITNFSTTTFSMTVGVDDYDALLDRCWYSQNSSGENITFDCFSNATVTISPGAEITTNITVYVNDTQGNENSSPLLVYGVDFTTPNLTSVNINNHSNFTNRNVTITIGVTDLGNSGLSTCWYTVNDTGRNVTFGCLDNTSVIVDESIDTQNITIFANDTAGNLNYTEPIHFNVDSTPPNEGKNMSLTRRIGAPGASFTFNVSALDDRGIMDSVWIRLQNPDGNNSDNVQLSDPDNDGVWNGTWDSTNHVQKDYFVDIELNDTFGNNITRDNFELIVLRSNAAGSQTNNSINFTANTSIKIQELYNDIRVGLDIFAFNDEVNDTQVNLVSYHSDPTNATILPVGKGGVRFSTVEFVNGTAGNFTTVKLSIWYNATELGNRNASEAFIYKFIENSSAWERMVDQNRSTEVDENGLRVVEINTTTFSTFGIFATPLTTTTTTTTSTGGGGGGGRGDASFVRSGETEDLGELAQEFVQRSLSANAAMSFNVGGELHSITVKELNANEKTVKLEIASEPFTVTMAEGEKKSFDVTGDTISDIEVFAESVTGLRTLLSVRALKESVIIEEKSAEDKGESLPLVEEIKKVGEAIKSKIRKPRWGVWIGILVVLIILLVGFWWYRRRNW